MMIVIRVILKTTLVLWVMIISNSVLAQDKSIYGGVKQSKAEELYENKGYKASILEYLKMDKITLEDKLKIANAYRLVHETENAELWYEQVFSDPNAELIENPIHLLHYAQSLQSNGKENIAAKFYSKYREVLKSNEKWDKIAQVFSQNVTKTGRFANTDVELRNERFINTDKLEFSPTIYDKGVVYVTTRENDQIQKRGKDKWLNENYMSLMSAEKGESDLLQKPRLFSIELTGTYHEGPVSFSNSNTRIYFTMNNSDRIKTKTSKKSLKKTVRKLQIYSSTWDGNKWNEPKELNINTDDNEEAHPALSADGKTMYFASDRPGGYGGMDIYVTQWVNNKWSQPKNLGKNVNTPGNEVFPFYHSNGMLFFSSNGHDGLGGLDIFHTSQENGGTWKKAINAGTPFNSRKDDFGMVLDPEGKYGYLTSARDGGLGKDDIYSFSMPEELLEPNRVEICVKDKNTGEPLANTGIKILEFESKFSLNSEGFGDSKNYQIRPSEDGNNFLLVLKKDVISNEPISFYTNEKGKFDFAVQPGMNYKFVAERSGYKLGEVNLAYEDNPEVIHYCIELEQGSDDVEYVAVPKDHVIVETAPAGSVTSETAPKLLDPVPPRSTSPVETKMLEHPEVGNPDLPIDGDLAESIDFFELGSANLKVGNVIVLENIYYDFNKHYIRRDAEKELDKVVRLMQHFSDMVIELGSHTDSRGGDDYNQSLSARRAEAAVDYIANNGIERERLVAKGYGEEKLRNSCRDGRKCSEKDHQFNRRTEIRILEMPNEINVAYNELGAEHSNDSEINKRVFIDGENLGLDFLGDDDEFSGNEKYRVFAGSYSKLSGAEKKRAKIEELGYKCFIIDKPDLDVYRIIAGEFKSRKRAEIVVSALQNAGINARIKTRD